MTSDTSIAMTETDVMREICALLENRTVDHKLLLTQSIHFNWDWDAGEIVGIRVEYAGSRRNVL